MNPSLMEAAYPTVDLIFAQLHTYDKQEVTKLTDGDLTALRSLKDFIITKPEDIRRLLLSFSGLLYNIAKSLIMKNIEAASLSGVDAKFSPYAKLENGMSKITVMQLGGLVDIILDIHEEAKFSTADDVLAVTGLGSIENINQENINALLRIHRRVGNNSYQQLELMNIMATLQNLGHKLYLQTKDETLIEKFNLSKENTQAFGGKKMIIRTQFYLEQILLLNNISLPEKNATEA